MNTLSHAGDLGDLLAACASFEAMGGDVDLCLYPAPGMVREPWSAEKVERCRSFLLLQPYITTVRYSDVPEGFICDGWRQARWVRGSTLADMQALYFGVSKPDRLKPWLRVDHPAFVTPIICHRSPRYHDRSRFPWWDIGQHYGPALMAAVGSHQEVDELSHALGTGIRRVDTPTLLDLARVIAACELYVGNQSAPYWLAQGLGVSQVWLEQSRNRNGNCYWPRPGALFDRQRKFPELATWTSQACETKPPAGLAVEFSGGRVVNLDKLGTTYRTS